MIELGKIYKYSDYICTVNMLKDKYNKNMRVINIGKTWENRDIALFIIGRGNNSVAFSSGVHGRESINPVIMLKIIEDCCSYREEYWMENTLYVIPLLNPDGYVTAMERGYRMWKGNGRGVDINRNFPSVTWKKKFIGDKALSEPETMALVRFFNQYKTDMYIDFHSRGKEIYYYRSAMDEEYNRKQLKIAGKISKLTGYTIAEPFREMETGDGGGNTVHYFSEMYKKPALTVETVSGDAEFPLEPYEQKDAYNEIKDIWRLD